MSLRLGTELGLNYELGLSIGTPKMVTALQQPADCFALRCERLARDITAANLALLSGTGNERGWAKCGQL